MGAISGAVESLLEGRRGGWVVSVDVSAAGLFGEVGWVESKMVALGWEGRRATMGSEWVGEEI